MDLKGKSLTLASGGQVTWSEALVVATGVKVRRAPRSACPRACCSHGTHVADGRAPAGPPLCRSTTQSPRALKEGGSSFSCARCHWLARAAVAQAVQLSDFGTPGAGLKGVLSLRNEQEAAAVAAAVKATQDAHGQVRAAPPLRPSKEWSASPRHPTGAGTAAQALLRANSRLPCSPNLMPGPVDGARRNSLLAGRGDWRRVHWRRGGGRAGRQQGAHHHCAARGPTAQAPAHAPGARRTRVNVVSASIAAWRHGLHGLGVVRGAMATQSQTSASAATSSRAAAPLLSPSAAAATAAAAGGLLRGRVRVPGRAAAQGRQGHGHPRQGRAGV